MMVFKNLRNSWPNTAHKNAVEGNNFMAAVIFVNVNSLGQTF